VRKKSNSVVENSREEPQGNGLLKRSKRKRSIACDKAKTEEGNEQGEKSSHGKKNQLSKVIGMSGEGMSCSLSNEHKHATKLGKNNPK